MEEIKNKTKEILSSKKSIIKLLIIVSCVIAIFIVVIVYYVGNINEKENVDTILELEQNIEEKEMQIIENENLQSNDKEQKESKDYQNIIENSSVKIAVHITGEVNKTGIIYLKEGARIADAIEEAGGITKNANIDQVNLAYILEDGQKIYIPNKKEKIQNGEYIISNSGNNVLVEEGKNNTIKKGVNRKVNINSANSVDLETLPGVGAALAKRIIEYREQNGKFKTIEEIQNVKGIGNAKYSNIKEYISI